MDAIRIIATRRIEEAMREGLLDGLPPMGEIECSRSGEAFVREWLARKLEREGHVPPQAERLLEIARLEDQLRAHAARMPTEPGEREALERKAAERNRNVRDYNLVTPVSRHLYVRPPEYWLGRALGVGVDEDADADGGCERAR